MNDHTYFRSDGDSVKITKLRPIEDVQDFASFADYVKANLSVIGTTREQFRSLDKKGQRELKDAQPYFVPGVPKGKPVRSGDYIARCNLLLPDIDDSAQASQILTLLELCEEPLLPWPYIVHHTVSSTPEKPRLRLMVAADGIPPSNYAHAVSTVLRALGLSFAVPESFKYGQPFYFPAIFEGEDAPLNTPIVDARPEGRPFSLADLDGEDLLPTPGAAKAPAASSEGEWEEYIAKPPLDGWTVEDAEELLKLFSPDHYGEWLDVGMALKHQFADDGFPLWDRWSQGTARSNYDAEEARTKWDTGFRAHAKKQGRSRTWATYILRAKTEKGWDASAQSRRQVNRVAAWIENNDRTTQDLQDHGIEKIAELGFLPESAREELLVKLHARRKGKEGPCVVPVRILRKELDEKLQQRRSARPDPLPVWAKGFCYVGGTVNEFYHVSTGHVSVPETFKNTYQRELPAGLDMSPVDYVLNACKLRIVQNYAYNPKESLFFDDTRLGPCVNTYRATYAERDDFNAAEAGRLLARHLEALVAEEEYRRTLMDWLAFQVQQPGEKVHWVPLIQGGQGCGKGTLGDILRDVLGDTNVRFIDSSSLESDFNEWAAGSQLVVLSEIHNIGDRRHKVVNRLKTVVADNTVDHDVKNGRPKQIANVTNYIAFTNHHNAVPLEMSDRRYFVIKSPLQTREQITPLKGHFDEFHAFREAHPGAFRAVLLDWKISESFSAKGHAPETSYKEEMRKAAQSPLQHAVQEALEVESPYFREGILSFGRLKEWILTNGNVYPNPRYLQDALTELNYVSKGRVKVGTEREALWVKRGTEYEDASLMAVQAEFERRITMAMKAAA